MLRTILHRLSFRKKIPAPAALPAAVFVPNLALADYPPHDRYMSYSTCSASDFLDSRYLQMCELLKHPPTFHRKLWEWVFIVHQLREAGVLKPGMRGLGFGVGRERLPAVFAALGAQVFATDAPPELAEAAGWTRSVEHSGSLEQLRFPDILADELLAQRVSHGHCDMRAIPDDLVGFDFCWSACAFEHLGSLEAGARFVIDSVEKTLRPGGVACHTTEFNLSSDEETVGQGQTVIYRRKDLLRLADELRALGHRVEPFRVAPDAHYLDSHVDVPPYTHNPHLKLRLGSYVTTSAGIVVRKRAGH